MNKHKQETELEQADSAEFTLAESVVFVLGVTLIIGVTWAAISLWW